MTGGGNKDDYLKFLACVGSSNQNRTSMVKGKGVEGQDPRLTRKERPTMTGVYIVNIKYLSKVNFTSKFETLFKRT